MPALPHPSAALPAAMLRTIKHHAAGAEEIRQLHNAQLKLIYDQRWFKMFVPPNYGGLGLTLPEVLRTEEALAWADGSTAWVVTLCSGAGWFVGFLDPALSQEIFSEEKACLAGSGAATGTAEIKEDGYLINGEWKYASGSMHATMFTSNCRITKGGLALPDHDGAPQVKSFIFFKREVSIRKSWKSMGMVATASHSFTVKDLHVPGNRSFIIDRKYAALTNPVYYYPFLQLAEATLVVNLSGMAQQFQDLVKAIFAERMSKDSRATKNLLKSHERSQRILQACRDEFYGSVERSWALCESGKEIPGHLLTEVSTKSHELYLASLSEVNTLYRHAGLTAANPDSDINRVWRNIHTASQHSLFSNRISGMNE